MLQCSAAVRNEYGESLFDVDVATKTEQILMKFSRIMLVGCAKAYKQAAKRLEGAAARAAKRRSKPARLREIRRSHGFNSWAL